MRTHAMIRAFVSVAVLGLIGAAPATAANITIKGSDTMVILAQRWAETYMKKNPAVTIQVTGGGSGTGIAALINKTTNLANSSRPIKGEEIAKANANGVDPGEYKVALDGLGVVVHSSNGVKELTLQQVNGIYRGDINDWSEVGGTAGKIIRYCRESNSGTYVFFKEHVLQNGDYAADCQTMPGTSAVAEAVSRDKNGIGYGGVAYFAPIAALRVLSIKKTDSSPGGVSAEGWKTGQRGRMERRLSDRSLALHVYNRQTVAGGESVPRLDHGTRRPTGGGGHRVHPAQGCSRRKVDPLKPGSSLVSAGRGE